MCVCVVILWVLDRLIMRFGVFDFSAPSIHCILHPGGEIRITHSTVYLLCLRYAVNRPYGHPLSYKKMRLRAQRESSRRRHSDDGELDLSGPLLIYRHGHDMSVCACVEGIFFDRNEVHGLICGRCWILALIKRWMLFVWAQLIGRECILQKSDCG